MSKRPLSLMTHEHSNMLFTTANHWSLWRATRMQSTTPTQKAWWIIAYVEWGDKK